MPRLNFPRRFHLKSVLALITAPADWVQQCLDHGWYCPPPLNGYLCTDMPSYCDSMYKTAANISPLYQFDAFDWTVLIIYFVIITVLALYGVYCVNHVIELRLYLRFLSKAQDILSEDS